MGPDGPRRLIRRTTGGQEVVGFESRQPDEGPVVSVALVLGTLSSSTGLGDEVTPVLWATAFGAGRARAGSPPGPHPVAEWRRW